jgi:hypothetical protein
VIVSRGLGRGAVGAIVAAGLCLNAGSTPPVGPSLPPLTAGGYARPHLVFDDRDLLEIVPIVVEVLNRSKRR